MDKFMISLKQEKLWLVDNQDQPQGEGWQWRSWVKDKNWQNFRVINAFIRNKQGKLWIPRRAATKRLFPLSLDVSVGGHVEYGESYDTALAREAHEELGIDVQTVEHKLLGYLNPLKHDLSAWMKVWQIYLEEVPDYNRDDFVDWYWLSPDEFRERMLTGEKSKSDLPKLINIFYP